jgi:hypothetical protein
MAQGQPPRQLRADRDGEMASAAAEAALQRVGDPAGAGAELRDHRVPGVGERADHRGDERGGARGEGGDPGRGAEELTEQDRRRPFTGG